MNIMITGPNGFLASNLIQYLSCQHTIYTAGKHKLKMNPAFHHYYFQLGDDIKMECFKSIDVLIHTAYDFSLSKKQAIKQINIDGSIKLLDAACKARVKKIIFISSLSASDKACSLYGKAKYAVEQFSKENNIYIIRPGLLFNDKPRGLIGSIANLIAISPIIPLIGNGKQLFYMCHIDSLIELINQLITVDSINAAFIINAAHPQSICFRDILKIIATEKRKKPLFIPIPSSLIYMGLKLAELMKLPLPFRSDSLLSLKNNYEKIDFSLPANLNIQWRPFIKPLQMNPLNNFSCDVSDNLK